MDDASDATDSGQLDDRLFTGLPPRASAFAFEYTADTGAPTVGKDFVVTASGLLPGELLLIGLCADVELTGFAAPDVCDLDMAMLKSADSDGDLTVALRYPQSIQLSATEHDCTVSGCAVVMAVARDTAIRAELVFGH